MGWLLPGLERTDGRVALDVDGARLTHAELAAAARAHAGGLVAAGVRPGDRVAVIAEPRLDVVVALVGNALAAVTTVPIDPRAGQRLRDHVLADAAPRLVLGGRLEGPPAEREVDHDAPLLVLYTSGTTGLPKGAVLSAHSVASNLDALASAWSLSRDDTIVHALPLFHVHGLVLGLFGSLRSAGCLRLLSRFEPSALAAALVADGPTVLFAVPTMYHRLAEAGPDVARGLARARLLVSGSAPLPLRSHRRIEELAGRGVHERYGLTETLIVTAVPAWEPPRPGSVGPPLDRVEVRLVDDARRPLDPADPALGEVAVRGPGLFAGYLGQPGATAAAMDADGFFHTGDLASREAGGALRIAGRRATDLIKTGGFRVGAGEVESCLLEDARVLEVAVVGMPDDDLGERIVAFVVPRDRGAPPAAAELEERVATELAPHKRPREVRFVDALPRNAMGKVQKGALRDE